MSLQGTRKGRESVLLKDTSILGIESRARFHKRVIAMTVLNAGNFVWMAKWVTFCDICFHYTLDHLLVNR